MDGPAQEVVEAIFEEAASDVHSREFADTLREAYAGGDWTADYLLSSLAAEHNERQGSV